MADRNQGVADAVQKWMPLVLSLLTFIGPVISGLATFMLNASIEQFYIILFSIFAIPVAIEIATIYYSKHRRKLEASVIIRDYNPSDRMNIPPGTRNLIAQNRKDDIKTIHEHLENGSRCVAIFGMKGVGKSFLAAFIAEKDDFWIDFDRKPADLYTLLIMCAQWLGDKSFEDAVKAYKKELGEKEANHLCDQLQKEPRRLFFDNLETLLDKKSRSFLDQGVSLFFEKLLTSNHDSQIIITSRLKPRLNDGRELPELDGVETIDLGGLSDEYGAGLLKQRGIKGVEDERLEEISSEVNGNPLLLKILPPLVNRSGGRKVLEDLKSWKKKYKEEVINSRLLSEAAEKGKLLLCRLSVIPDSVNLGGIKFLCGRDLNGEHWTNELVSRSLLEWDRKNSVYRLHPAIAETALNELKKKPKQLREAQSKAVEMYKAAAGSLEPKEKWRSLEDCYPYLRVFPLMIELGDFENASLIVVKTLHDPLNRWGHWRLLRSYYEKLLILWEKLWWKPRRYKLNHSSVLGNYGSVLTSFGEFSKAIELHKRAINIDAKLGNKKGICLDYGNLGIAYKSLSEYSIAIKFHNKSLKIAVDIFDRRSEGNAYGNLGIAYELLGDYKKAIYFQEKHLKVAKDIGDQQGEGNVLGNLGNIYFTTGYYRKAIDCHKKALVISKELGIKKAIGTDYGNLGISYNFMGEYRKAIEFHEKHLEISKAIGDRVGEGNAYGSLGNSYAALGKYHDAIEFLEKRLKIAIEISDLRGEGNAYGALGNSYAGLGKYREAIWFYEKHLDIALTIGDRSGESSTYSGLGNNYLDLGEHNKAIEFHEKHLKLAKQIGDRRGEGTAHLNLGVIFSKLEQRERAIKHYKIATKIHEDIEAAKCIAFGRNNIAFEYSLLGDWRNASIYSVRSLLVFKKTELPKMDKAISVAIKCRDELGEKRFREIAVESVGDDGADEVEKILAAAEEAVKEKEKDKDESKSGEEQESSEADE